MRALLVALSVPDPASLRAALSAALGTSSVDLCQATEAAVTWLENRPCDLVAIAGHGAGVVEGVARVRRVSKTIPVLVVVPDPSAQEAGAAWLSGADDVITASALVAGTLPEGLDEVRHPERDVLRRTQRLWYAGPADTLRQHLVTRLGARFREVGLTAEGLAGLTTQDVEAPHSAALIVNALVEPESLVLGVRRVKRTYPGLAVTVVADGSHHDAFRRAGADECVGHPDVDPVLHAVGRAQSTCRAALELDQVRGREMRLRALLEHLPEAVMLVSPEHAVLAVNLAALRLIGAQDARQVIGTPLSPWFDAGEDDSNGAAALIDGVVEGATRELLIRTRHLADPRRLQLKAVPFQRETGGPPAALIVLREVADAPLSDSTPSEPADLHDDERRAWEHDRADLAARLDTLTSELIESRVLAESLREAHAAVTATALSDDERHAWEGERRELGSRVEALTSALAEARSAIESLTSELDAARAFEPALHEARAALHSAAVDGARLQALQARLDQVDALGIDLAIVPSLLDAAHRLQLLEQDEMPALLSRLESQRQAHEDALAALQESTQRLAEFDAHDVPALRAAADDARGEHERLAGALLETQQRVAELEAALSAAWTEKTGLERDVQRAHAESASSELQLDVPAEHRWLLQEIAHVGFVRTTSDGRVLDANDHAARLCGHRDAAALVGAGALPAPLTLLAAGDEAQAARFEVCLQLSAGQPPRWIAGARLPQADDEGSDVTWLLADATAHRREESAEAARPETLNAVLEVVAAECATIVDEGPVAVRGPRPIEAVMASPVAAQALERARVLLAQVSSFRRRREGQAALDDLRAHLTTLGPLLSRLATEDVEWELSLPDEAIHVSASASDIERCLTALVASARDALPLGGRLSLSVATPGPADAVGLNDVRRLDARLVLDAQGYGLLDIHLPAALRDLAANFGGEFEVSRPDTLTQQLVLRVPRAFVISHAA
jgi:PAS domain-containing protein